MIVAVTCGYEDDNTDYLKVEGVTKVKFNNLANRFNRLYEDGYSGGFCDYLREMKINFEVFKPDLEVSI